MKSGLSVAKWYYSTWFIQTSHPNWEYYLLDSIFLNCSENDTIYGGTGRRSKISKYDYITAIQIRCHETPHHAHRVHCAHRTVHRRARRVTIRYDTIGELNVDWKAEYSALSSNWTFRPFVSSPLHLFEVSCLFPAYSVKTQTLSSGCFNYISAWCAWCTWCAVRYFVTPFWI